METKVLSLNNRIEIKKIVGEVQTVETQTSPTVIKEIGPDVHRVEGDRIILKTTYRGAQGPRGDTAEFGDFEISSLSEIFEGDTTPSPVPALDTNLITFAQRVRTETQAIRTLLNGNASDLSALVTANKDNLVMAINELVGLIQVAGAIDDTITTTIKTWSSSKIIGEITTALNGILAGAPTALNTLDELAAALGDDANFAATVTLALSNRVRTDTATQGLNSGQKTNARVNIDAIGTADIGDYDFDYVALFNQGLL